MAVRIGNSGQVYESDQPQLVRQVIPGGFGPPMQQRVTGPDDFDDPDSDNATIANVTMSPHGDNATKAEAAGGLKMLRALRWAHLWGSPC